MFKQLVWYLRERKGKNSTDLSKTTYSHGLTHQQSLVRQNNGSTENLTLKELHRTDRGKVRPGTESCNPGPAEMETCLLTYYEAIYDGCTGTGRARY